VTATATKLAQSGLSASAAITQAKSSSSSSTAAETTTAAKTTTPATTSTGGLTFGSNLNNFINENQPAINQSLNYSGTATSVNSKIDDIVRQAIVDNTSNTTLAYLTDLNSYSKLSRSDQLLVRNKVEDIFSSADKLAQYLKANNVTNPEKYAWFSTNARDIGAATLSLLKPTTTPTVPTTTTTPTNTGTTPTGTTPTGTTPTGTNTPADSAADSIAADLTAVPDVVKNSDYWKLLTPDEQVQIAAQYNLMTTANEQEQQKWLDIVNQAKEIADPYFKQQLRISADEVANNLEEITQNWDARASRLSKNLEEIRTELGGAEELSPDEEATLRAQETNYKNQMTNLQNTMASRGLTSSTLRNTAEEQTNVAATDLREGTTRQMARERLATSQAARDYSRSLESQYGTEGAQKLISGYDPYTGEALDNQAKTQLGKLSGISMLGGIAGTEAERRAQDVYTRAQSMYTPNDTLINPFQSLSSIASNYY
jgi:hypothetical protein